MADDESQVPGRFGRGLRSLLKQVLGPFSWGQGNIKATGVGAGLGIIIGVVIEVLTDNGGLWLSLGLVFGAAWGNVVLRIGNGGREDQGQG